MIAHELLLLAGITAGMIGAVAGLVNAMLSAPWRPGGRGMVGDVAFVVSIGSTLLGLALVGLSRLLFRSWLEKEASGEQGENDK